MKVVVDMNLSPIWVQVLRGAGFDATHWRDIGQRDAEDSTVLDWAKQHGYVVLTHDLDFGAILAASRADAPSVIQFRVGDPLPSVHAEMVIGAIKRFEAELRDGALISIEPGRARARFLPLQG
jgi:predicted nuclease of predicted toxin-antitoxin system